MAVQFAKSSNNKDWFFYVQVVLISVAALSLAFILHLSLPVISSFIVTQVPSLWTSMKSWLTPPYLYIVINGIIITIAASSRFHHHLIHHDGDEQVQQLLVPPPVKQSTEGNSDFFVSTASAKVDDQFVMLDNPSVEIKQEFERIKSDYGDDFVNNPVASVTYFEKFADIEPVVYGQTEVNDVSEQVKTTTTISATEENSDELNEFADSRSILTPINRSDSMEIPSEYSFSDKEKPPVSARFSHRKTVKGSSNEASKALRSVAKPKRNDTLENTWKTITEGRSIPLARHLKKSDTWETHHNNAGPQDSSSPLSSPKMKKSETFVKDGYKKKKSSSSSLMKNPPLLSGSVRLRKEPSLSQDDLNRRVEAFINKFNEEMRLQRQASLNQYKEMVTRVGGN